MSAREELFRRVVGSFVDEERANKLIDDLLHEEAEKIRNTLSYAYGCLQAADLIDPYVKGD